MSDETVNQTTNPEEPTMTTTKTKSPRKPAAKKAKKSAKKAKTAKTAASKANGKANGAAKRGPRAESKTAEVLKLMKRAKGVTRAEVLELTGWTAVSMQKLAQNMGVKLKVSEERPFHYMAV